MTDLTKIHIRHALLSNRIMITRMGKDPTTALDRRDATGEFLMALTSYVFGAKMPAKGDEAAILYGGGDEQFRLTLERLDTKEGAA